MFWFFVVFLAFAPGIEGIAHPFADKKQKYEQAANRDKRGNSKPGACKLALDWATSSPSDGLPGGRPKPRKSRLVSAVMPPTSANGALVIVATAAFGKIWRNMICSGWTPIASAAATNSKLRARRNSARTIPTKLIHENSSRTHNSHQKLGTMTELIMIMMNSWGIELQTSRNRMPQRSSLPP